MPNAAASPAALRQIVGPPAHEASKFETSIAPPTIRSRMPVSVVSRLAGADRDPGLEADVAHPAGVIGPAHGLFEPADVEVPDVARELDRLGPAVALVGIDHQHELWPGRLAGDAHPPASSVGVLPPTLNFTPAKPASTYERMTVATSSSGEVVVAADDADRDVVGGAAPQAMERQAERTPEDVPDRLVDARDRLQRQAAVAQDVVRGGLHGAPRALGIGGVRPSSRGASSSWMIATMIDCSTSVSPV